MIPKLLTLTTLLTLSQWPTSVKADTVVATQDTDVSLNTIIEQIETQTNQLPIEKVKAKGDSVMDLTDLLQQKQRAISKKIAAVTEATKPKPKEEKKPNEKKDEKKDTPKDEPKKEVSTPKPVEQRSEAQVVDQYPEPVTNMPEATPVAVGDIQFGANGLLIEQRSGRAQQVVNGLLGIPGHSNGAAYHRNGLDNKINQLTTAEAIWVIHRIEGAGFGQTSDGYAGYDTPASHRAFVNNQVNRRFGGSVHALLRAWGTFSYGGY